MPGLAPSIDLVNESTNIYSCSSSFINSGSGHMHQAADEALSIIVCRCFLKAAMQIFLSDSSTLKALVVHMFFPPAGYIRPAVAKTSQA